MANILDQIERNNLVFDSSSDYDASSESSYSPNRADSEDCGEMSGDESDDTLPKVQQSENSDNDEDVAWVQQSTRRDSSQNNFQQSASSNAFIWHQPPTSFSSKHPTHDYIQANQLLQCSLTCRKSIHFKSSFQRVCAFLLPPAQMEKTICKISRKMP